MSQQRPAYPSDETLPFTAEEPAEAWRGELAAARIEIDRLRDALKAAEARERVLAHEVQHRVRNMLAVIRSIFRRTRESGASNDEFAEHFQGRLDAVARYQTNLDDLRSTGFDLEEMIRNELLETRCLDRPDCVLEGPQVYLRQKAAEMMGLTIHELATNSIKFGALGGDGRLSVQWSVSGSEKRPVLHFRWTESGTALIAAAPRARGFGQQLIEEALPYQFDAKTSFDLRPGSLQCTILLPLSRGDIAPMGQEARADGELPLLPSDTEGDR